MTPLLALLILAVVGLLVYVRILAVVGLLVYVRATNPKTSEIGRMVFGCAFLALCLNIGRVLAVLR